MSNPLAEFNSPLNPFRPVNRINPDPIEVQQHPGELPSSVPFVYPVDKTPNNLGDIEKFSPLNQLAAALGTGGVGASGLAAKLQHEMAVKKQQQDNKTYSQGLVWAATQATQNKNFLNDLTQKSVLPPNQNPMFVLGAQVQGYNTAAAQYRNELVQARIKNPAMDPVELQNQVKQNYAQALQGGSPEAAYKFFIEPAQKADENDVQVYQSYAADGFKKQYHESVKTALSSVADASLALYQEGKQTLPQVQASIQQQFESSAATMAATGIPLEAISDSAMDAVIDKAKDQATLKEKLAVLSSLQNVRMPNGQLLLSSGDAEDKFHKAQHQIAEEDLQQRKLEYDTNNALATQNTNPYLNQIVMDAAKNKLGGLSSYLPKAYTDQVNYKDIVGLYNQINSSQTTTVEQSKTNDKVQLLSHALHGDPQETLRLGSSLAASGLVSAEDVKGSVEIANTIQNHNNTVDKLKLPTAEINERLKGINPPVPRFGAGRWSGSSDEVALQAIPIDLRRKYNRLVTAQIGAFLQANPKADPLTINQKLDSIMDNLQPSIHKDYDAIRNKQGLYQSIIAPPTSNPLSPAQQGAPKTQRVYSFAQQQHSIPWSVSPQAFAAASQQFQKKQGPMYDWVYSVVKKHNKLEHMDDLWQIYKSKPDLILELLEKGGYPTFRKTGGGKQ